MAKRNLMAARHTRLREEINKNPFVSDEQLAGLLKASIHTIRSDRRKIGIPEVRKRGADLAGNLFAQPKSLSQQEIVGEILELVPDKEGLSILETTSVMGLKKTGLVRGHVLFAQANTLANALANDEIAVTAESHVQFLAPAHIGEKILAKARVINSKKRRKTVEVILKTPQHTVLQGTFTIYALDPALAGHLKLYSDESAGKNP